LLDIITDPIYNITNTTFSENIQKI